MFLRRHRKKLLRGGAQADAVVTECQGANLTDGGFAAYKLLVEVHFPDGSQAEVREKVQQTDIGPTLIAVGDVVPVRYDPSNRSVVIDTPAIRAKADEKTRRIQQESVARARRTIDDGA